MYAQMKTEIKANRNSCRKFYHKGATGALLTLILTAALVLGLMTQALAADTNSITVNNAKLGETYNIYKLIDIDSKSSDNTKFIYTLNNEWTPFFTTQDGVGGAGKEYVNVTNLGSKKQVTFVAGKEITELATVAATQTAGKTTAAAAITVTADHPDYIPLGQTEPQGKTITFGGLDAGYYLITSTLGTNAMIATTPSSTTVSVNEKNVEATDEKLVQEDSSLAWGTTNSAQIGDTVHFKATVNAKKGAKSYIYHDLMDDGLTLLPATITVQADDTTLTEGTHYTVRTATTTPAVGKYDDTNNATFEVHFAQTYLNTIKTETAITITYDAVLNSAATTTAPEYNREYLTWGGNGKSSEAATDTHTYKFSVLKHDGNDKEKVSLAGATFKLFNNTHKTNNEATPVYLVAQGTDGTTFRVATPDEIAAWQAYQAAVADGTTPTAPTEVLDSFTTVSAGATVILGVDLDVYTLVETKAPAGYNMLTSAVSVTVTDDNATRQDIANNSGTELPATGGMGTTLFYLVGAALVLGAGLTLVTRRRMAK